MEQRVKDKLDLLIAVAIIAISNLLPVMDAGPFAPQSEFFSIKAEFLFYMWWMLIICFTVRFIDIVIGVIKWISKILKDK